mmetsp:Transcript_2316/g.4088  ORF Transcript_2316/g.4088 Transcript_2316/m.4088 type:complete len:274 (-) Transcript_2316:128-949(-)
MEMSSELADCRRCAGGAARFGLLEVTGRRRGVDAALARCCSPFSSSSEKEMETEVPGLAGFAVDVLCARAGGALRVVGAAVFTGCDSFSSSEKEMEMSSELADCRRRVGAAAWFGLAGTVRREVVEAVPRCCPTFSSSSENEMDIDVSGLAALRTALFLAGAFATLCCFPAGEAFFLGTPVAGLAGGESSNSMLTEPTSESEPPPSSEKDMEMSGLPPRLLAALRADGEVCLPTVPPLPLPLRGVAVAARLTPPPFSFLTPPCLYFDKSDCAR